MTRSGWIKEFKLNKLLLIKLLNLWVYVLHTLNFWIPFLFFNGSNINRYFNFIIDRVANTYTIERKKRRGDVGLNPYTNTYVPIVFTTTLQHEGWIGIGWLFVFGLQQQSTSDELVNLFLFFCKIMLNITYLKSL